MVFIRYNPIFWLSLTLLMPVMFVTSCADFNTSPALHARHLVTQAAETVDRFKDIEALKSFATHIPDARALVIFPSIIKAGFVVAGEGGNGILIARNENGKWGQPGFVSIGAASVGGQIGAQETEVILVVRNDGALRSLLDDQAKLGADAGLTVGIYGVGVEASTTTNLNTDIVAFANSKLGLFLGVSLEGAVLAKRHNYNQAYYGATVTPQSILAGEHQNPHSDILITALTQP